MIQESVHDNRIKLLGKSITKLCSLGVKVPEWILKKRLDYLNIITPTTVHTLDQLKDACNLKSEMSNCILDSTQNRCEIIRLDCADLTDFDLINYFADIELYQKDNFFNFLSLNSKCTGNFIYYVAFDYSTNDICGVCQTVYYPTVVCVEYLTTRGYNSPEFKGIGTLILDTIKKDCIRTGRHAVYLYSYYLACSFYIKNGFIESLNGLYWWIYKPNFTYDPDIIYEYYFNTGDPEIINKMFKVYPTWYDNTQIVKHMLQCLFKFKLTDIAEKIKDNLLQSSVKHDLNNLFITSIFTLVNDWDIIMKFSKIFNISISKQLKKISGILYSEIFSEVLNECTLDVFKKFYKKYYFKELFDSSRPIGFNPEMSGDSPEDMVEKFKLISHMTNINYTQLFNSKSKILFMEEYSKLFRLLISNVQKTKKRPIYIYETLLVFSRYADVEFTLKNTNIEFTKLAYLISSEFETHPLVQFQDCKDVTIHYVLKFFNRINDVINLYNNIYHKQFNSEKLYTVFSKYLQSLDEKLEDTYYLRILEINPKLLEICIQQNKIQGDLNTNESLVSEIVKWILEPEFTNTRALEFLSIHGFNLNYTLTLEIIARANYTVSKFFIERLHIKPPTVLLKKAILYKNTGVVKVLLLKGLSPSYSDIKNCILIDNPEILNILLNFTENAGSLNSNIIQKILITSIKYHSLKCIQLVIKHYNAEVTDKIRRLAIKNAKSIKEKDFFNKIFTL